MINREPVQRAANELIAAGVPFVAATVVRAQSPTSVRPGDAAVVLGDGKIEGFVGGACAETSVRLHSLRVLETGEPLLLRILPGEDEREAGASEGAITVKNPCLSGGALEIFLEPHLPPATVRVVGRSPIALALADLAKRLGYAVELRAPADAEPRPDDTAVVVASHGYEEERTITAALRAGVPYVGLVASEVRGEAVRQSLDLPGELRAQLHTPAGLDIGAETPEEIALAILGHIVALQRAGDREVHAELATAQAEVATDPVCGMEVAVSDASIQVEVNGERHYFCSEGCRDSFVAEAAPDVSVG